VAAGLAPDQTGTSVRKGKAGRPAPLIRLGCAVSRQAKRTATGRGRGGQRVERHQPTAGRVGPGVLFLAGKTHRDLLTRRGAAPDRHGLFTLEDHVVAEDARQADVGAQQNGKQRENKEVAAVE
jgi:hypothetical protein